MAISNAYNVPAIGFKAFASIVGEPVFNFTVNRNAVVVIQND
jgi:hypothetical protein